LKSLDSDERIQGNPRESNTHKRGLRGEMATRQENPNRQDERPAIRPGKEPNRSLPTQNGLQ
jgi:hypothetical protein